MFCNVNLYYFAYRPKHLSKQSPYFLFIFEAFALMYIWSDTVHRHSFVFIIKIADGS